MTEAHFRELALALPGVEESKHMGHPDFRVNGKIFATMGYPRTGWAMVKLERADQARFAARLPEAFVAVKGKWGEQGCTNIVLKVASVAGVKSALRAAYGAHKGASPAVRKASARAPRRERRSERFTFILIPGAGGDPWYWHLVVPELKKNGYEAIAVPLPAADDRAGLARYADAVVRAIGKRAAKRVAIVAQSLGGFTAPLVCERLPVALLVLVNAMIPKPGETPGQWWGDTGQAAAKRLQNLRDGRAADAPFDPLADFFHDVPRAVVDGAWARGEPRQSDSIFRSPCTFKSWPKVPTRVLVGREDRFFPAEFQRSVARQRLGLSVDEMPGGHLVALSRPNELSARLISYAETITRG